MILLKLLTSQTFLAKNLLMKHINGNHSKSDFLATADFDEEDDQLWLQAPIFFLIFVDKFYKNPRYDNSTAF